jgi:carbon-monoxide dehydrogenase large subunit
MNIRVAAAFNRRGKLLAARLPIDSNLGAHPASFVSLNNYRRPPAPCTICAVDVRARGVLTNTTPTCPFRGAGRPRRCS